MWCSPLRCYLLNGRERWEHGTGLVMRATSNTPVPLLRYCAENAFFKLSQSQMVSLCTSLHVECEAKTLKGALQALVEEYIPDIEDQEMLRILRMRLKAKDRV